MRFLKCWLACRVDGPETNRREEMIKFNEAIFDHVAKGYARDVVTFARRHLRGDHIRVHHSVGGGYPPRITPAPRRGFLQEIDTLLEKYMRALRAVEKRKR